MNCWTLQLFLVIKKKQLQIRFCLLLLLFLLYRHLYWMRQLTWKTSHWRTQCTTRVSSQSMVKQASFQQSFEIIGSFFKIATYRLINQLIMQLFYLWWSLGPSQQVIEPNSFTQFAFLRNIKLPFICTLQIIDSQRIILYLIICNTQIHECTFHCRSFGCTVIEMTTGHPPWHELNGAEVVSRITCQRTVFAVIPNELSNPARDFIACCLQQKINERWSASQLLQHSFVVQEDSRKLDFA